MSELRTLTRTSSRMSFGGKNAALAMDTSRRMSTMGPGLKGATSLTSAAASSTFNGKDTLRKTATDKTSAYIEKLTSFMLRTGAPVKVSAYLMRKDVVALAAAVLAAVDPALQVTDKSLDDDYPRVLALLGYPHKFQKSWLKSTSSSSLVLMSLCWLIDNVAQVDEAIAGSTDGSDPEADAAALLSQPSFAPGSTGSSSSSSSIGGGGGMGEGEGPDIDTVAFFRFSCRGYERWLSGASDQVSALDPALAASIASQRGALDTDIASLNTTASALHAAVAAAEAGAGEGPRLEGLRQNLRQDRGKLEEYTALMEALITKLSARKAAASKRVRQLEEQAADLAAVIAATQTQVSAQEVSPEDADKMRATIDTLKKSEAKKAAMLRECEGQIAAVLDATQTKVRDLEALAAAFNTVIDGLDMADGAASTGEDGAPALAALKLNVNPAPVDARGYLSKDLQKTVAPALNGYLAALERRIQTARRECEARDDAEADMAAEVQRKTDMLEALCGRLAIVKEALAERAASAGAVLKKLSEQVQAASAENEALGSAKAGELAEAKEKLEALQRQAAEMERAHEAEREKLNIELCEVSDLAATHLACMQAMFKDTLAHAEDVKSNLAM